MTLYLYKTGANVPVLTIEHVVSYTENRAETEGGTIYTFAEDAELSSKPDCSETLRADWRRDHPEDGARLDAVETKMSAIAAAIEKGMRL